MSNETYYALTIEDIEAARLDIIAANRAREAADAATLASERKRAEIHAAELAAKVKKDSDDRIQAAHLEAEQRLRNARIADLARSLWLEVSESTSEFARNSAIFRVIELTDPYPPVKGTLFAIVKGDADLILGLKPLPGESDLKDNEP